MLTLSAALACTNSIAKPIAFAGGESGNDFSGNVFTGNAGAQADYENRRIYGSLKSDFYDSSEFTHRIDTLQLCVAPYTHEYDQVAVWLLVQGRTYTGDLYGVTEDGNLQSMVMVNF